MRAPGWLRAALLWSACLLVSASGATESPSPVTIGSKAFTESVVLGEMLRQLAEAAGVEAEHRRQLGGTRVLWNALRNGDIDAYAEYDGTLIQEIFRDRRIDDRRQLQRALAEFGLRMSPPLGFNNTYALGVSAAIAERTQLRTISDLRNHPELTFGFSNEFMDRQDGWRGLQQHYQLPHTNVRGLDHDLAYRGLAAGTLDVTDVYTTDAEIAYYDLRTLEDDRHYFPSYHAVILYRAALEQRAPRLIEKLKQVAGRIDASDMQRMNGQVKLQGHSEAAVAAAFLQQELNLHVQQRVRSTTARIWQHTVEHLLLVVISLTAAIVVAIPLGVISARRPRLGHGILALTGLLQTLPALALFVFMIPLLGIGGPPAVVALFLYSLLPIVRNTYAGLTDIPRDIIESAKALGLPPGARLRVVELPLATRSILAGIKTSAVINVGTATLGALIGAGGYGQPILTGIRLDDIGLILQGAVPAAVLALLVQGLFELLERQVIPRGLRPQTVQKRARGEP